MWIERVTIENFLAFRKLDASFDRGLNVVLAPNEGGKSSLFRAVTAVLFVDAASRTAEVRSLARWGSADLFRIELRLFIGERRYRLVRDFRAREQEIRLEGESAPAARGKAVDAFLAELLPLADKNLFLRVCGVRHGELDRAADGEENLGERLEEILGGGGEGAAPARAAELVDRMRKDLVRGADRPAKEENWGAVKRFSEERAAARAALDAAREAARRREGLSRAIAARRAELEAVERDLEALAAMRDRAARYRDLARRGAEAGARADGLRKRVERLRRLSAERGEAAAALERLPEQLRAANAARIADLRAALDREATLERERGKPRAGPSPAPPPWLLLAGLVLLAAGAALGFLRHRALFVAAAAGAALSAWWVHRRLVRAAANARADTGDAIDRLREERAAWFPGSSADEARSALEEAARLGETLRALEARLEEAAGGATGDPAELIEALDREYGASAVDARALGEQRAALEAFAADADRILAIERELEQTAAARKRLAAGIEEAERARAAVAAPDAAAPAERLEAAEENLARAERRVRVLEIAAASLDEARRGVSGSLAEGLPPRVAPYLSRLTGGRYGELHFDPRTLAVTTAPASADGERGTHSLPVPERIDPGAISQGARDQLYLAVRLALVDLLGRGESQPLFLDDPFVHFDPERRGRALDLLREFSASHQIIFFTCDPAYREAGGRVIELDS